VDIIKICILDPVITKENANFVNANNMNLENKRYTNNMAKLDSSNYPKWSYIPNAEIIIAWSKPYRTKIIIPRKEWEMALPYHRTDIEGFENAGGFYP
jgi:hypothetical protein